jgi:metal-responsive CopG/Arc/MetJ family transcriptional regulator
MDRSVKFAVSLPESEFQSLEEHRKKEGVSRSKLVLEALRLWKENKETKKMVRTYQEGYRRVPEKIQEIAGWEKVSVESLSQEDW